MEMVTANALLKYGSQQEKLEAASVLLKVMDKFPSLATSTLVNSYCQIIWMLGENLKAP